MSITTYAELKTAVNTWGKWSGAYVSLIPDWIAIAEDKLARKLRVRAMETQAIIPVKKFVSIAASSVGGTADAITLANDTATSSYTKGESYTFTAEADNTSTTVTVNVDGKGAKTLYEADGSTAPAVGRIINGATYDITYDGAAFRIVPAGGYPLPTNYVAMRRLWIPGNPVWQIGPQSPPIFWSKHEGGMGKPKNFTTEGDLIVFGPNSPDTTYYVSALYYKKFTALSADVDTNWILTNARGLLLYGALVEGYAYLNDLANVTKWATMQDTLLDEVHKADRDDRYSGDALVMQSDVAGT